MIYFKVIIYILQAQAVFFLCMASYFAGISHQLKKDIKERARRFETDELRVTDPQTGDYKPEVLKARLEAAKISLQNRK